MANQTTNSTDPYMAIVIDPPAQDEPQGLSCCSITTIVVSILGLLATAFFLSVGLTGGFEHLAQWVNEVVVPAVKDFLNTIIPMNVGEILGEVVVPTIAAATIISLAYKYRVSIRQQCDAIRWQCGAMKRPSCKLVNLNLDAFTINNF